MVETSRMRLQAWHNVQRDIEFDPSTGGATIVQLAGRRPPDSVPQGFATFERSLAGRRFAFAVFRLGEHLFLNAGQLQWQLGQPTLVFRHRHLVPFVSRFQVMHNDQSWRPLTGDSFRQTMNARPEISV